MAANSFGNIFRFTTFGESHGVAVGVVIDGCPAGLELAVDDINQELALRAPGKSLFTSERKETDGAQIVSGVFEGKTTGAPICILIQNQDSRPSAYESIKSLLRPGHANYTYMQKYGVFDYLGGGRASARETAARVAAGAIAKKLLKGFGVQVAAYIKQIGIHQAEVTHTNVDTLRYATYNDPIYCPDATATKTMQQALVVAKTEGDSLGGMVEFIATGVPCGLGDPVYEKLEARIAYAMMSLPASKGFEIGSGFSAVTMKGSLHNDQFIEHEGRVTTKTNHAGGTLAGIATGMPIIGRVAFKPTSSIKKPQATVDIEGKEASFILPEGSRHDPCLTIRAVPVVEAMCALVLADALLLNRCARV
ncbi:MAG: chorismate synthase [Chlamydiales bacterium]|nr:chorismate synthase [Chlamydiales bacterium]